MSEETRNKKINKIIFIVLILLVIVSMFIKFKKYVLDKDYFVYLHAPCEDSELTCFSFEDEAYLKVYRKAYIVESCMNGGCDPFICNTDEENCMIISCSEEELEEGESCVNK